MTSPAYLSAIAADADTGTEVKIYAATPEHAALMEWVRFHGIDPDQVLAGYRISRDACGRCIRYVSFDNGPAEMVRPRPAIEQGEAAPLPYPDVIARRLR